VVEEFLDGEEASFFALVNGEECVPLIAAQVGKIEVAERVAMQRGQYCGTGEAGILQYVRDQLLINIFCDRPNRAYVCSGPQGSR
jgi:hypothetical protein